MNTIVCYIFLFISSVIFAQIPTSLTKLSESNDSFDTYKGSIYNTLRYTNSSIIDEKSGKYDAKLRYNIFSDALEFKKGTQLFHVAKSPTTHARIDDEYFYYCEFKTRRGAKRSGYYVLVDLNEQYRIYKKYSLKIIEPRKNNSNINTETETPGNIIKLTKYYIEEGGAILELPMKKKELLYVLGDEMDKLKEYIKKEKIRLRKEEDLIRLVFRYNTIKNHNTNIPRSLLSSMSSSN